MMTLEKRRIELYLGIPLAVLGLSIGLLYLHFRSNEKFHENISVISAMLSLFTGLLAMIRYYAKRVCPYLWVGLAFAGNGVIELVYSYAFSFYPALGMPTGIDAFMRWGCWIAKVYLSVMLIGSYITCRASDNRLNDKTAYTWSVVLLSACLYILLYVRLPALYLSLISSPLELLPGALYLVVLIGFFKYFDWKVSSFSHWLICGVMLFLAVQLFILPYSREVYDARFATSNVLTCISYLLVIAGLLAEIFKLYRKNEEESIRLAAARLAMDQVKDYAVFMIDPEGYIMTWNKGAEQIKGYKEDEIIGKNFSIFYPEKDKRNGKPARELRIALAEGHAIDEDWRIKKDGSRFWALVTITPVYDPSNSLLGFVKITKDLTASKLMEEELKKQNEELANANEQLTQFAYIATHDLKEPLRTISSFTQLLVRACNATNENAAKFSEFIIKAVERTRKLIDDLRTYSMIKSRGMEQQRADLNSCVADAVNLLKKKVDDSHTELRICKLPTILGSATQLMYLFLHLIDNAMKYSKPNVTPFIDVCCRESGTEYIISVKDNGVGIPKEYSDKLFSIFRKLDEPQKTDGSGIGLFICKNVVAAHGGRIWFESDETGTSFYFALPMITTLATK